MGLSLFDVFINLIEACLLVYFTMYYSVRNNKWNLKVYCCIVLILFINLNLITVSSLSFIIQDLPGYIILFCALKRYSYSDNIHIVSIVILSYIILQVSNTLSLFIVSLFSTSSIKTLIVDDVLLFDIAVVMSKLVYLFITIHLIKNKDKRLFNQLNKGWKIFIFAIVPIWIVYINIFEMLFSDELNTFSLISTTIAFTIFCPYMYLLYLQIQDDMKQKIQDAITIQKLELEKECIDDLVKLDKNIRTLRHDMKHTLGYLLECLNNDDSDKMREIITMNLEEIQEGESIIFTKNETLNYILNSKNKKAKSQGKTIRYVLENMDKCNVEEQDFIYLLGNLLDNAIEHSSKEDTIIYMNLKQSDYLMSIEVINGVDDNLTMHSKKENSELHGYGMKSIQHVVNKYDGVISYELKDSKLFSRILIKNNRLP